MAYNLLIEKSNKDYELEDFMKDGRSKGINDNFDPEQIKMGIEIEYEHTRKMEIARKIAYDHLAEIPDYYTRLAKMEEEAKRA